MKYTDFPKVIEIQFHNRCNSNCLICPYKDMNYRYESMSDETFNKFINEIDDEKMTRLIPYLNNEPFIDLHFIEKITTIREKCHKIEIEISTNAYLISEKILYELKLLNITDINISVFGYKENTYKKMMPDLDRNIVFENLKLLSKILGSSRTVIYIVMIDNNEIEKSEFEEMKIFCDSLNFEFRLWGFLDRSGNVSYKSNGIYSTNVCDCEQNRPLERMHILANGDVLSCCQDWSHTLILGNIKNHTITEIWNSDQYKIFRKSLYDMEMNSPEICKKCKIGRGK